MDKLKDFLKEKNILKIETDRELDISKVIYYEDEQIKWFNYENRELERLGYIEKTVRLHKKSPQQIKRENRILLIYQLLRIIIPFCLSIYFYQEKNVAGFGFMVGITLAFLLQLLLDKKTTDLYERRK